MATTRRFIDKQTILDELNVTYVTVWTWMRQGKFPRSYQLGPNKIGWDSEEYEQFKASRPRTRLKGDTDDDSATPALAAKKAKEAAARRKVEQEEAPAPARRKAPATANAGERHGQ